MAPLSENARQRTSLWRFPKETLIKSLRTVNRIDSLQCLKLHQAARSAWGLGLTARER